MEDISIALARIPGFLVVSRNSAKRTEIPAGRLDELQDEVVREIVSRIEPELKRAELSTLRKRHAVDLGAWSLYRQGHAILSLKGWSEASFSMR